MNKTEIAQAIKDAAKQNPLRILRASCLQDNFKFALERVKDAVDARTPLPVLGNVLIRTDLGRLVLETTDTITTLRYHLSASVETDGAITVPHRDLSVYVSKLSPERVDLNTTREGDRLLIVCGAASAKLKGIDAQEFPITAEPDDTWQSVDLQTADLIAALEHVLPCLPASLERPVLNNVCFEFRSGQIEVATADGYRLAVYPLDFTATAAEPVAPFKLLVQSKSAQALLRGLKALRKDKFADTVELFWKDQTAIFSISDLDVVCELFNEGIFPDYREIAQAVLDDVPLQIVVDRGDLIRAIDRASIWTADKPHCITLDYSHDKLLLTVLASDVDKGEYEGLVDTQTGLYTPVGTFGPDHVQNFNAFFLLGLLKDLTGDFVSLRFSKVGLRWKPLGGGRHCYNWNAESWIDNVEFQRRGVGLFPVEGQGYYLLMPLEGYSYAKLLPRLRAKLDRPETPAPSRDR